MAILKHGDHGAAVTELQRWLNYYGATLPTDGWFGDATEAALVAFQRKMGLIADGCAGRATLVALSLGTVPSKRLLAAEVKAVAEHLQVHPAALCAVLDVESRGEGFLPDGRPAILFERHVFYKRLAAAGAEVEGLAARFPMLVNPQRGGYAGGSAEWLRLTNAQGLAGEHSAAAYESCSWGLFQIMGYHWARVGYGSCAEFVAAMDLGEPAHLVAFARFVESDPALLKALRARKWADFAKLYNGPAYKENRYDVKLASAFEHHDRLGSV
ncbi:MAG: DUF3380 domain-containing protein [Gammaproteobacteria bacterium]|nr:DUF3380 domain-containing protein [Gammaproteobacteria bacterium]